MVKNLKSLLISNPFKLFAVLVAIRLIYITMPILEGTAMRQVQTAMIARNFFKDGINILYPRVDFFGNAIGYLVLEFPLMNTLAAFVYMLLGGVHEWVGRFLSIAFFSGAACFLYCITKRIFEEKTAFWAVLVFGLSPLSIIFSRAFMPDFEMIFFCMGALYFFLSFCDRNKYLMFWASALFLSLAMLVKPHSFYILVPLLYLVWRRQNWKFIVDYKNWLYLAIAILPAFIWYFHGTMIHASFTQSEVYNYQMLNWFNPAILLDKNLYINIAKIHMGIFLTPVGLILFLASLFIKTNGEQDIIWAWLFGGLLYMLAFITHMWEPYYHLVLLPIISIFIARAIVQIRCIDWKKLHLNYKQIYAILIILFLPFFLRYSVYAYVVPKGYRYVSEAGRRIQDISKKEDLIVASAAGGPQALYFCDRKGWTFTLPEGDPNKNVTAIKRLKSYIENGAEYFVAAKTDDFEKSPYFKKYLFDNYDLVEYQKGKFIIFKLE